MYDFSIQKEMLLASSYLLKEKGLYEVSALGGGTALAAHYWDHRYSTDIDIFVHSNDDIATLLNPNKWNSTFKAMMNDLGYTGDYKINPIYTEFVIKDDFKMQFLSVIDKTDNPYNKIKLWGIDTQIESIEEIITKKIYFRADKGNARDLFDIALAIHKDPSILNKTLLQLNKINNLYDVIYSIKNNPLLKTEYLTEISLMNPHTEYNDIALNTIEYLETFLESYCGAVKIGMTLDNESCTEIEKYVYDEIIVS